jgi:hypothetical protein
MDRSPTNGKAARRLQAWRLTQQGENNTKLLVNFGQSNAGQIRMALASLKSEGETITAAAALGAARDFDDARRFEGVIKRVLIITGGQDSCTPQAADVIRRELQKRKIRPSFWLIGMDVPPDQQRQLNEIRRATDGKIFPVKNQHELENVLERIFEIEPVIAGIKSVLNILNSIIDYLNKSIVFLNQKSYMEAENEIKLGSRVSRKQSSPSWTSKRN